MNSNLNDLTFQEQDILELLIFGNSINSISQELFLDKNQVQSILFDLSDKGIVSKTMDAGYVFQYQGPRSEFFSVRQQTLLENVNSRMGRA